MTIHQNRQRLQVHQRSQLCPSKHTLNAVIALTLSNMSQQTSFTLQQQISIGLGGVLLGLPFIAFSLDTPVSHLMLAARTRPPPHATDLEKSRDESLATDASAPAPPRTLLAATKQLWDLEGWRGFVKGFLPEMASQLIDLGSSYLISSFLLDIIASRRSGSWRLINAILASVVRNLIVSYAVNPAVILRTRMRLQTCTRTTKQEIKYLSQRAGLADFYRSDTIVPAFLRYATQDFVRALAVLSVLPAPLLDSSGAAAPAHQTPVFRRLMTELLVGQAVAVIGAALAFPFTRCQELAAVSLKPLEEPSIRVHDYQGFADEIVKDSAWNGFVGSLQRTVLSAAINLGMVLPPFLSMQFTEKHA
jgi:hypothetical protein